MTAGVINKPSTYPPKEIDGFVVAGGPDASETEYRALERGFATPDDVERFLRRGARLPRPSLSDDLPDREGESEVDAVLDLIDLRFEAAEQLLDQEDPDFLHLTVFYSMALQHYFWDDEPVRRAWGGSTRTSGASSTGPRHPHHVRSRDVARRHGVLRQRLAGTAGIPHDHWRRRRHATVARRHSGARAFRRQAVRNGGDALSRVVPERIQRVVPWKEGVKHERILSIIDWDETQAVASNQGPIYLTKDPDDPGYEALRNELIESLEALRHPTTGEPIVKAVYRGEEYYEGPYAENAPDLILDQGQNVHTSDAVPDDWLSDSGVWAGGNMPDRIFVFFRGRASGRRDWASTPASPT